MNWSTSELAMVYGCTRQTIGKYIKELVKKKKYKKLSPGKFYSEQDVRILAALIGFDFEKALLLKKKK